MRLPALTHLVLTCVVLSMAPSASAQSTQLFLTEFMPNPSGTDIDREWLEIYNAGPLALDISGYAVGDGLDPANISTGEAMGVLPAGTIIGSGEVCVIAVNENGFSAMQCLLPAF